MRKIHASRHIIFNFCHKVFKCDVLGGRTVRYMKGAFGYFMALFLNAKNVNCSVNFH